MSQFHISRRIIDRPTHKGVPRLRVEARVMRSPRVFSFGQGGRSQD
ncbi:MAG: hypothetical protein JO235_03935 [Chroococcidiopsidaceae cyanobacterium CP_BM_RX_35]|nr:hypothetical protein [Chroococcidiopsidaceae cyanobacterium CP_BM_RX_35]